LNSHDYRRLVTVPNSFHRGVLEQTEKLLRPTHPDLAEVVQAALSSPPVPKPSQHAGGPETDHLLVQVPEDRASAIVDALLLLEAAAVSVDGETTFEASASASLVDQWGRYLRFAREAAG
jgi:hypothetical protein